MRIDNRKGFTLIEVIVVVGIIAILASILVPMVLKEIEASRSTKGYADVRSIATSIVVFKKDTAKWPNMDNGCAPNVTLLTGDGNLPPNLAGLGFDAGVTSSYNDHLSADTNGCYNNWQGAYMTRVTADPWGNTYITNADSFVIAGNPVWILSAGANGQVETPSFSTTVLGDDIGMRLQ
ncbi:MAG: type II secretion system protein GspG [Thermodesulfovibrionales bacterium]